MGRNAKKMSLMIVLSFFLVIHKAAAQENEIKIVGGKYIDSPSTQYLIKLYSEVFERAGYRFVYKHMPNNRASIESDKGDFFAGELSRVSNYSSKHPKLTRLDIPHYNVRFVAISAKHPKLRLDGWESLRGKDYKVAYRRGTKIIEDNLPKVIPRENIIITGETEQGLKLALSERVDIFIEGSVNVSKFFNTDDYKNSKLYFPGVMQQLDIHMFIHENFSDLIPKLNIALKEVKKEGLFEEYRKKANFEALDIK